MTRILNTKEINQFDPSAIWDTLVEVCDGIFIEEKTGIGHDYFSNIPVNKPLSEVPLEQLLAESYIDTPGVCQYGGHVVVKEGDQVKRYGAGEIRKIALPPDTIIVAVQPYLPRVPGITEKGSLIQVGEPGLGGFGRLTIGPQGYSIHSNMTLFVEGIGKYKSGLKLEPVSP